MGRVECGSGKLEKTVGVRLGSTDDEWDRKAKNKNSKIL
jgi:hypothetical protein